MPFESVNATLKVGVPSLSDETLIPLMSCVTEVTLPLPLTEPGLRRWW